MASLIRMPQKGLSEDSAILSNGMSRKAIP